MHSFWRSLVMMCHSDASGLNVFTSRMASKKEKGGGLALWLRLAEGVGLDVEEVRSFRGVLPGVRMACDHYVELVHAMSLLEAVALSLTELFAADLMSKRVAVWEEHDPWVNQKALAYFRTRVSRASLDCKEALEFVLSHATTYDLQERCVKALIAKTQILWHILDCLSFAYIDQGLEAQDQHLMTPESKPRLAPKVRLRLDQKTHRLLLLFPERGILLNPTAAEIIKRCKGKVTVTTMVDHLMQTYDGQPREVIETETLNLLQQFHTRGLIRVET